MRSVSSHYCFARGYLQFRSARPCSQKSIQVASRLPDHRAGSPRGLLTATILTKDERSLLRGTSRLRPFCVKQVPDSSRLAAVVFVTKAFAKTLGADNSHVLSLALNSMFSKRIHAPCVEAPKFSLTTIVAVVDKVPSGCIDQADQIAGNEDDAHEGISMLVAGPDEVDVQFETASSDIVAHPHPHLTFTVPASSVGSRASLKVPLANTIFENGLETTFYHMEWNLQNSSLICQSCQQIRSASISLSIDKSAKAPSPVGIYLPGQPLTGICRIKDSLGNVIRRLESLESDKTSPASAELTQVIMEDPAKAANVFAVITESISSSPTLLPVDLHGFIRRGMLIRRVTGGGGEWGNRAALVTLDDQDMFNSNDDNLLLQPDEISYPWSLRPSVAPSGRYIQFFQADGSLAATNSAGNVLSPPLFMFGCIRESTINHSGAEIDTDTQTPGVLLMHSRFGALSSKAIGIALTSSAAYTDYIDIPHFRVFQHHL